MRRDRDRIKASPLARKRAQAARVVLSAIAGSGPGGRIIARDIDDYTASDRHRAQSASGRGTLPDYETSLVALRPLAAGQGPVPAPGLPMSDPDRLAHLAYRSASLMARPHSPERRQMIERLALAQATVPVFKLQSSVGMAELQRALMRMNGARVPGRSRPLALSLSDFLVKALGLALQQVPRANVSFTQAAMLHHETADVALALLDTGDDGDAYGGARHVHEIGSMSAVISHADLKSLSEIADERAALTEMAVDAQLDPRDMLGGVTRLIDLTGTAVTACDALVLPPHSSALTVGALENRAVAVAGEVLVQPVSQITLAVDQRAIDETTAVRLLDALRGFIEDPMRMLV